MYIDTVVDVRIRWCSMCCFGTCLLSMVEGTVSVGRPRKTWQDSVIRRG